MISSNNLQAPTENLYFFNDDQLLNFANYVRNMYFNGLCSSATLNSGISTAHPENHGDVLMLNKTIPGSNNRKCRK